MSCACRVTADLVIVYCPGHAAAPELLSALRRMIDAAELIEKRWRGTDLGDAVTRARVAVERAEGAR